MAHELHDTLAQGLSGVALQLEAAEEQLLLSPPTEGSERLARLLAGASTTARTCLADTRRAVEALRPEPLDVADFGAALEQVCRRWSTATGVPATVRVDGDARRCPAEVEIVGLRVAQEALANTSKYAAASSVRVRVEYHRHEMRIVVSDDGVGFDPARPSPPDGYTTGGLGLAMMRERVADLGGTLTVSSHPDQGTTVTASLPVASGTAG